MWIHLAQAIYSAMTLFALPLLFLAAMAGAEVLLDRTLRFYSNRSFGPQRAHEDTGISGTSWPLK
jgi:hypothetical protein